VTLVLAAAIALTTHTFIAQLFYIPTESMAPTLAVNDRVLVERYRTPPSVTEGTVVVFTYPAAASGYPAGRSPTLRTPGDIFVIKRVVALGGDEVTISDGILYVNGHARPEPYLAGRSAGSDHGPTRVPDGTVFVLGDNRHHSLDSRHTLGPVPTGQIVGRARLIIWPAQRISAP
jgi:signal peptidase I